MNIDKNLLEAQIATLSKQLDKDLNKQEREDIECLLNVLGDIADGIKEDGIVIATDENKEIDILKNVISFLLDDHGESDIFNTLHDSLSSDSKPWFNEFLANHLGENGYISAKGFTMQEKDKIVDYIKENIFTSLNEQSANLFYY